MRSPLSWIPLLILGLATPSVIAGVTAPQPIYTSKHQFRIPFQYDAAEMRDAQVIEVRLYLSVDRGKSWNHVQSVAPQEGRFEFQPQGDNEYWFAVCTFDRFGQMQPPVNEIQPELIVVVDSQQPALQLECRQTGPTQVGLAWRADDPHLDITKLRLEYIQEGENQWQAVSVAPLRQGRTAWSIPNGGFVAVRGSVEDRAGNVAHAEQRLHINSDSAASPASPMLLFTNGSNQNGLSGDTSAAVTNPVNEAPNGPAMTNGAGSLPMPPAPATFAATPSPVIRHAASPRAFKQNAASMPRYVNSRNFEINYRVDSVGPSGVGQVELFITQDQGQKWWKYGDDADLQSPFSVEVPFDGQFGFQLRVRSGVGIAETPPQPGEAAEIAVIVDETPPTVQLLPPQRASAESANDLLIRWTVSDQHLADQPVALAYSATPQGPWNTITDWQANSGSYRWTVDAQVPPKIYLQIAARDLAGNLSTSVSPQPIIVDLEKPRARIVNIETHTR